MSTAVLMVVNKRPALRSLSLISQHQSDVSSKKYGMGDADLERLSGLVSTLDIFAEKLKSFNGRI